MKSVRNAVMGAVALSAVAAVGAQAGVVPITSGSGWIPFYFGGPGSSFQDINGATTNFTFTLTTPTVFRVVDGYYDGDQFDVTINNVDQGPTSTPTQTPGDEYVGNDFSSAFYYTPGFSKASYLLGPGSYTVTGIVLQSPFGAGQGAVSLGANVPEPATWAMMLIGFAGIGFAARGRSRKAVADLV